MLTTMNGGTENRYLRQITFAGFGAAGQCRLAKSKAVIVGVGGLGTVTANCLARSGVGFLRLIDKDCAEVINLHRQILFTEEDALRHRAKAEAACAVLAQANSEIVLEPAVCTFDESNADALTEGADIILDCSDNWQTRFVISGIARRRKIPWIYCAALAAKGMTMNFLPAEDEPCIHCLVPQRISLEPQPTCAAEGIMNMAAGAAAALQAAEAVKILTGSPHVRKGLFTADFWQNQFRILPIEKDKHCPVCSTAQR